MASLIIIAGVILSILIGVAFCPFPFTNERSMEIINAAIKQACNKRSLKNFIKCEVIPGLPNGIPFDPQTIHVAFGYAGGVIFATATPSPLETSSGPSGERHPPDPKLIWKVTGATRGPKRTLGARTPIYNKIRVAVKFQSVEDNERRDKEAKNLQTLSTFGLAPAQYVLENAKGHVLTDFIIMERIDGVTLVEYIEAAKKNRELQTLCEETKLRLPGLRLLYIHLETMLLLERLHIEHKWRHCDLDWRNVMIRKSTKEGFRELAEQLRKEEREYGQMEDAHQEAWISLQLDARLVLISDNDNTDLYQTNNNQMVFVGTEMAEAVDLARRNEPTYYVCSWLPDISAISIHWRLELGNPGGEGNPNLTRMRKAIQKIFVPLTGKSFTASEEEQELRGVIRKLKALEEEEKGAFIAHLPGPKEGAFIARLPGPKEEGEENQGALGLFPQEQSRRALEAQYKTGREPILTGRHVAGSSINVQAIHQTQAVQQTKEQFLPQQSFLMQTLPPLSPLSADIFPHLSRAFSFRSAPQSTSIKTGILRKQKVRLPEQRYQRQEERITQQGEEDKHVTWAEPLTYVRRFQ